MAGLAETAFAERGGLMKKAADILRERRHELAHLMASEIGKPLEQGVAETEKCAWACDHYAEHAESHLAHDVVRTEGAKSYVAFEPLGVVLAIMPWNFPLWSDLGPQARRCCSEARFHRARGRIIHRRFFRM